MKVIFIYCHTNGLHQTNEDVIKKNLFEFARLVSLHYEIGTLEKNIFKSIKKVKVIIKPRCMIIDEDTIKFHGITNEIEDILNEFKKDTKDIKCIITHNIDFHLKTIMAEFIRYNIIFSFDKFMILDLINFHHNYNFPKLNFLYNKIIDINKNEDNIEIEKIKQIFIKLLD